MTPKKLKLVKAWAVVSTNEFTLGEMFTSGSLDKPVPGRYFIFPRKITKDELKKIYNAWDVVPVEIKVGKMSKAYRK